VGRNMPDDLNDKEGKMWETATQADFIASRKDLERAVMTCGFPG
jgi:hypothetical protein